MSADDTMDVFGEAFMRMVRERLTIVATADSSGGVAISLVDKGGQHAPRQEIACTKIRVIVSVAPPVAVLTDG